MFDIARISLPRVGLCRVCGSSFTNEPVLDTVLGFQVKPMATLLFPLLLECWTIVAGTISGDVVFVAPAPRGDDILGDGSANAPFATLPRAKTAVRASLRRRQLRASSIASIDVSIAPGAYYNLSLIHI